MTRSSSWRRPFAVLLLVAGVVAVTVAAFLVFVPLGLFVAGVVAVSAGYVMLYVEAKREIDRSAVAP